MAVVESGPTQIQTVLALTSLHVWVSLKRLGLSKPEHVKFMLRVVNCALAGATPDHLRE